MKPWTVMCAPRRSVEWEQRKARLWGSLTFHSQKRRMRLLGELEGAASEVREKAGGKYFREWWSGQQCWKQPEIKYQYWWFCVAMNQRHCFWKSPLDTRWLKKKKKRSRKREFRVLQNRRDFEKIKECIFWSPVSPSIHTKKRITIWKGTLPHWEQVAVLK